jgi:outer membrane protein OmpA-like peptidoglycan-associated protein
MMLLIILIIGAKMTIKYSAKLKTCSTIAGCLLGMSINTYAIDSHCTDRHEVCPDQYKKSTYSVDYQEMLKERPISQPIVVKPTPPKPAPVVVAAVAPKIVKLDDDKDGIYNESDKCPATPKGYKVDADGCPQSVSLHLNFKSGSDVLPKSADKDINTLVHFMQENPAATIEIVGHTDNIGSAAKNLQLSKDRAHSLAVRVIENGIPESRISSDGKGMTQPIASNKTKVGKARNRRIDIKIK